MEGQRLLLAAGGYTSIFWQDSDTLAHVGFGFEFCVFSTQAPNAELVAHKPGEEKEGSYKHPARERHKKDSGERALYLELKKGDRNRRNILEHKHNRHRTERYPQK
jgi:hypothetical protein